MLAAMSNVEAIWKRVTTCLGEHAETMKLRPAASEATIGAGTPRSAKEVFTVIPVLVVAASP